MAFKMQYATKAEVPAELQAHFVEKNGVFVADTEISEHPSFIAVRDKKDELLTEVKKVKGERDEARTVAETVKTTLGITDMAELPSALKGKASAGKEELEKLVAERVAAFKADSEKQIKTLSDQHSAAQSQLQVLLIDNAITGEATKAGIAATAMQDVLLRGRNLFKLQEGKPVPMDGDKVIYGKNGVDPMPVSEWMGRLVTEAPHLFNPSQGGGAKPGAGAGGAGTKVDPNLSPTERLKQAYRGGTK